MFLVINNRNCIGDGQVLIQTEIIQPRLDFSHRKEKEDKRRKTHFIRE